MQSDLTVPDELLARGKRVYALGRLRSALLQALLLAGGGALVGQLLLGSTVWRWAPLSFVAWVVLRYRGRALLRGGRYGLIGGALTCTVPLSWLRPCCVPGSVMSGGAVCTMPGYCVLTGALLGLTLALLVPRGSRATQVEGSMGVVLGVLSLAGFKCAALFAGEALGLVAGLTAGIVGMSMLSAWLERRAEHLL